MPGFWNKASEERVGPKGPRRELLRIRHRPESFAFQRGCRGAFQCAAMAGSALTGIKRRAGGGERLRVAVLLVGDRQDQGW